MKRKTLKSEQKKVDRWNDKYRIGQEVNLIKDSGEVVRTKTRSAAEVLSGRTAVIWLDGIAGCHLLDRVTAISQEQP